MTDKIDELVSIIIAESTLEEIPLIKDGLDQHLLHESSIVWEDEDET